jgi:hypothetical protein
MAKKKVNSKKQEMGKEEKHSKKHDELKAQGSSKAGGQIKGNPYETDLENFTGDGKRKKNERGFENDNKLDNGNNVPAGLGLGFGNPDLSGQIGKVAAGKGCLTTIIGVVVVVVLLMIF